MQRDWHSVADTNTVFDMLQGKDCKPCARQRDGGIADEGVLRVRLGGVGVGVGLQAENMHKY